MNILRTTAVVRSFFGGINMETVFENKLTGRSVAGSEADLSNPAYQAFAILRAGFTVAPIIAGVDKFLGLLANWDQYLPPVVNNLVGGHGHEFMYAVGVIEIVAGIGVALKPRIFAYVVAAWLVA